MSLDESKQLFKYMSRESKARFKEEIFNKAEARGMLEISFESFFRQVDQTFSLSCSDVVYALTAVLEAVQKEKENVGGGGVGGNTVEEVCGNRKNNFLRAYDMLETGTVEEYTTEIENYKTFQKILIA